MHMQQVISVAAGAALQVGSLLLAASALRSYSTERPAMGDRLVAAGAVLFAAGVALATLGA